MLDLLIRGGQVLDGSGSPAFRADVAVAGGRIEALAPDLDGESVRMIDASGLYLAPGFIDAHTHSDLSLLADPRAASKIRQGVTTEVIGNCGSSSAPLAGAALAEARTDAALLELEVTWHDFAGYLDRLRAGGTAVNVVPQVGHNTVRAAVVGLGDTQPDGAQLAAMERLVEQAMEEGARGLSTGLYYPPGFYAPTAEVVALARVTARRGGFYSSHIRSESDGLLEAVDEAVAIGRQAGLPVEIAHLKVSGFRNWGLADALIERLETARRQGVPVGCDQYPYAAGSTWLAAWLPYWAQAGGGAAIAARLRDAGTRERIRAEHRDRLEEWQNRSGVEGWSDILIVGCPRYPELQGQTVAEVAAGRGRAPIEAAMDLLAETDCEVSCVWFSQSETVVDRLIRLPYVAAGSDSAAASPEGVLGRRKTHPRTYGTFPRILGRFARERGALSLAEAVRKMTGLPAAHLGLEGRGTVRPGAWADLVVFAADQVADRATYAEPQQYPAGIPWVIVNGQIVVDQGRHTGALPGQVL